MKDSLSRCGKVTTLLFEEITAAPDFWIGRINRRESCVAWIWGRRIRQWCPTNTDQSATQCLDSGKKVTSIPNLITAVLVRFLLLQ